MTSVTVNPDVNVPENAQVLNLENAFHDLSAKTTIFRNRLIEEFQLLDNIADMSNIQAPKYTSKDIKMSRQMKRVLVENPQQLIKFPAFKRALQTEGAFIKKDKRLTRARNAYSLPVGAWAGWAVNTSMFQNMLVLVILLTAIFSGLAAEWELQQREHWRLFQAMHVVDLLSIFIFILEVFLKWIDDFSGYWSDGWNVFDFILTILAIVPYVAELALSSSSSAIKPLRTLRILRTLKMVARFGSLKIIVLTTLKACQSLGFILLLLIILAYIYAVIGVNIFDHYARSDRTDLKYQYNFMNVGSILYLLFQLLTLDHWYDLCKEMIKVVDPAIVYLWVITWVWLGAFVFRNIFIGIIVNDFESIRATLMEKHNEYVKQKKLLKMRRKLNKELQIQNFIQKSVSQISVDFLNAKADKSMTPLRPKGASHVALPKMEDDSEENMQGKADRVIDIDDVDPVEVALKRIQQLLSPNRDLSADWEKTVTETTQVMTSKQEETFWPRDSLFEYLQLMENLQENLKEFEILQSFAVKALLEIHDD